MSELKKDILYHVMIDYDGTLCFQNKISFKNKSAIKKAQKEGYKFILNTGRSRGNLPKEALQIDWDYIICGANYIEKKGEVIYRDEIPYSSLVQAFRVAKNVGSSIEFEGEKGTLYCKKEEIKNLDEKKFNIFCDEIKEKIKENPITKVDLWKGMDNRIDAKLQDFAIIHHNEYVELFKKGATKGTIALKLMEIEKFNIISVEHIQDIVERNISLFNFEVAKKFIIYRYEHKEDRILRDRIDYMSTYINSDNNAATSSEEDSNSNVTVKNVANLNGETFKNLNRRLQRLWIKDKLNELFPEVSKQYAKDLEHHIIYAHDEASFPVPTNYCEAVSLYPLIMNGTSTMDGLKTKPPTNLNSFCGQLINLTFLLAAQCKGAVAYGEFFNFFDYFCVKE